MVHFVVEFFFHEYRRFIASPTLNNSKKKVELFWKLSLNVIEFFFLNLDFFWQLSLNVVENVAKDEFFSFFFF